MAHASAWVGSSSHGTRARVASGSSGTCVNYVRNLRIKLKELDVVDPHVEEFWKILLANP